MELVGEVTKYWTVADLIKELSKFSPVAPVCMDYHNTFSLETLIDEENGNQIIINFYYSGR